MLYYNYSKWGEYLNSGYKSPFLSYWMVLVILALELVYFMTYHHGYFHFIDTISYEAAADVLLSGKVDQVRTPLYPLIIALFRWIAGDSWEWLMIAAQTATVVCSAYFLKEIADWFIKDTRISFWIVAFYLLCPGFSQYMLCPITEAFAASGVVFALWLLVKVYRYPERLSYAVWSFALWFLLLMLRPSFLYLLLVYPTYFLIVYLRRKPKMKFWIVSGVSMVCVLCAFFSYKQTVSDTYHIKSICTISSVNNYASIRQANLLCPELAPTPEMRELLETFREHGDYPEFVTVMSESVALQESAGQQHFEEYINNVIVNNKAAVGKLILYRLIDDLSDYQIFPTSNPKAFIAFSRYALPSYQAYLLLCLVFTVVGIRQWIKYKRIPVFTALFLAVTLGMSITSILGAPGDFERLSYPGMSAFMLVFGKFCSMFHFKQTRLE